MSKTGKKNNKVAANNKAKQEKVLNIMLKRTKKGNNITKKGFYFHYQQTLKNDPFNGYGHIRSKGP